MRWRDLDGEQRHMLVFKESKVQVVLQNDNTYTLGATVYTVEWIWVRFVNDVIGCVNEYNI